MGLKVGRSRKVSSPKLSQRLPLLHQQLKTTCFYSFFVLGVRNSVSEQSIEIVFLAIEKGPVVLRYERYLLGPHRNRFE